MTANPITDQIAAGVRAKANADPNRPPSTLAKTLADQLVNDLPDLTPQTIGAVALHAASYTAGLTVMIQEHRGLELEPSTKLALNILAIAGEQLYTTPAETSGT